MKKFLDLMAILCLAFNSFGQMQLGTPTDFRTTKQPLFVDSWMRLDEPLGKLINYKNSTATLNDFKGKLIILDFWFTRCSSCIKQFPKEDSLQKLFDKDIQFILVTFDSEKQVKDFFVKWQARTGIQLSFPMIVSDTVLRKAFYYFYNPHYVWIFPDGQVVGQTAPYFLTVDNINGMLKEWATRKAFYDKIQANQSDSGKQQSSIIHTKNISK